MLDFNFANPYWLLSTLAIICYAVFLLTKKSSFQSFNYKKYFKLIDKKLLPYLITGNHSTSKKNIYLIIAILILLTIAIAGPRWNYEQVKLQAHNNNLVILLDVSQSMKVADVSLPRITRAKQEISDILEEQKNLRVSIIAFAALSHIISPLSQDFPTILEKLSHINPDIIYRQGSNINTAFESATKMLENLSGDKNILLITDGGFSSDINNDLIKKIKSQNIKFFTLAIGSKIGGPIPDHNGEMIYYQGEQVISKLELNSIEKLSNSLNGKYLIANFLANDTEEFLKFITNNNVTLSEELYKRWHERFYLFLIPAMLLLAIFFRKGFVAIFLIVIMANNEAKAELFLNQDQSAQKSYLSKDYSTAADKFTESYNKGVSHYRNKKYKEAAEEFAKGTTKKDHFNLGNSYFMQQDFSKAIDSYNDVLEIDQNNKNAKHNLEIAKKLLKKQQKQQQQNNKDNKQQQEEDKKDKSSQDQKNEEQNKSKDKQQDKQKKGPKPKKNESDIFKLIESDTKRILQYKIQNKERMEKGKTYNLKPW